MPQLANIGWRIILDASVKLMIIAIMAGGQSRRMGQDKAFVKYRGVDMVQRVLSVMAPLSERVVIISNWPEKYEGLGVEVYPDQIKGMGPLSGLYTAFERTEANQLLLAACDMPLISDRVVAYIISQAHLSGDAVIPLCNGREQGLLAIYRKSAIDKFRERIERAEVQFNEFRKGLIKSHISEAELQKVEPSLDSFKNVNQPDELE